MNPMFVSRERALPLVLALAALVHLTVFVVNDNHLDGDSASYLAPARSMASGDGFVDPDYRRTPGYPLFLLLFAPFDFQPRAIAAGQHAITILSTALVYLLGLKITGEWRIGALAATLFTIDLPTLNMTNKVYTETLFTVTLLGVLLCLHSVVGNGARSLRLCVVAGVLMGWATFTRPVGVVYAASLACALFVASSRWRIVRTVVFVLCAAFLPSLWAVRNDRATGVLFLSTIASWDLYYDHAAAVLVIHQPGDYRENVKAAKKWLEERLEPSLGSLSPAERSSVWRAKGLQVLSAHPWQTAKTHARAAALIFLTPGAGILTIGTLRPALNRLLVVYTLPCLLLSIVGGWRLWRDRRGPAWIAGAVILAAMLSPAYGEAYSRFRVPIMPVYAVAIATGAFALTDRARAKRQVLIDAGADVRVNA
jgi:hypothetical protein